MSLNPAYEANQSTSVPIGTVVKLRKGLDSEFVFKYCCGDDSGNGSSSATSLTSSVASGASSGSQTGCASTGSACYAVQGTFGNDECTGVQAIFDSILMTYSPTVGPPNYPCRWTDMNVPISTCPESPSFGNGTGQCYFYFSPFGFSVNSFQPMWYFQFDGPGNVLQCAYYRNEAATVWNGATPLVLPNQTSGGFMNGANFPASITIVPASCS